MPFLSQNYRWNSVDVRQDDGPLHYGRIIDCTEDGLTIDFGCKDGISAQVVPFGRIYHTIRYLSDDKKTEGRLQTPVEALIRLNPDEPAKWYPATLSEFSSSTNCGLIKAVTWQSSVVEILKENRIRDPRNGEMLHPSLLKKGDFAKEEVELPSGFSTGSLHGQLLVDSFNENCKGNWMVATHIDGNVLHVVKMTAQFRRKFDQEYRGSCPKLEGDTLRRLLEVPSLIRLSMQYKQLNQIKPGLESKLPSDKKLQPPQPTGTAARLDGSETAKLPAKSQSETGMQSLPSSPPRLPPRGFFFKLKSAFSRRRQVPKKMLPSSELGALTAGLEEVFRSRQVPAHHHLPSKMFGTLAVSEARLLPGHIWGDVFQCLDGVEQAKCRRVCVKWNCILTSANVTGVLYLPKESSVVIPPVCLLKSWNQNTKVILNTGWENVRHRLEENGVRFSGMTCDGLLFRCIMENTQLPVVEVLVLASISWKRRWSYLDGTGQTGRFAIVIQDMCNKLNSFAGICRTLVIKDVTVTLALVGPMGWEDAGFVFHISEGRVSGAVRVEEVWDKIDSGMPAVTNGDRVRLMEYITDGAGTDLDRQLLQILKERQSDDPRDSNPYRGVVWTAGDLAALDWGKLSKLTVHSLIKAASYEKLVVMLTL